MYALALARAAGTAAGFLRAECHQLRQAIDASSGAKLAAEIAAIAAAAETDRASTRRELGKMWARLPGSQTGEPHDKHGGSELDAFLELQRSFNGGGG